MCLQFVQSLDKCCNCQLSLLSLSYLLTVLSVQCNPWILGLIIPSSVNILLCELCCASNSLCVFFLRRPWLRWNIHWQWGRHYFPQLAQQLQPQPPVYLFDQVARRWAGGPQLHSHGSWESQWLCFWLRGGKTYLCLPDKYFVPPFFRILYVERNLTILNKCSDFFRHHFEKMIDSHD